MQDFGMAGCPTQAKLELSHSRFSVRLARHDLFVPNKELGGALLGAADDRQQAGNLLARDEAELAARWARKHSPIGVLFFADVPGVLQDKNGSSLHLFGDPLAQNAKFSDHVPS